MNANQPLLYQLLPFVDYFAAATMDIVEEFLELGRQVIWLQ